MWSSRAWGENVTCADRRRARRSPKGLRQFTLTFALVAQGFSPAIVRAQAPVPAERVTFDEAIRRAAEKNPTAAIAAAGILRAEGLLLDARAASRLQINGNV